MGMRQTRGERKEQTRAELVATARQVFLRRGFHQATLEEIAEEAGYTKGAVYSNFGGKDELFLAVLDEQYTGVLRTHGVLLRQAATLEAGMRAAARQLTERARQDPDWIPLLVEFWTHASRREQLRIQVRKRHQQQLDAFAGVLTELAARHKVRFAIPPMEVARSVMSLARGFALERLLDPDLASAGLLEDMLATLVLGCTRPAEARP